jgi:hypothetical protein
MSMNRWFSYFQFSKLSLLELVVVVLIVHILFTCDGFMLLHFSWLPAFLCMGSGNGNKDGLFSVLLRDYKSDAAASCMNRLAKLR